jgi:hypothetical protein
MAKRIQIDEPGKRARKEHLAKTIQSLRGKSIAELKEKELLILVEHLCSLHEICDPLGNII